MDIFSWDNEINIPSWDDERYVFSWDNEINIPSLDDERENFSWDNEINISSGDDEIDIFPWDNEINIPSWDDEREIFSWDNEINISSGDDEREIFSWDDESSDYDQQQQNNPNETLTPPLLTINSSSSPSFQSTINIRYDNNSNNDKATMLRTSSRSSSSEYPDSLSRTSSSQCVSEEETFFESQSINGWSVGDYRIEAINRAFEELKPFKKKEKWINHYCSLQTILLVGEGDFSFSASLGTAFGTAANVTATSLDSEEFLLGNYMKAMSNIQSLRARGGTVLHGIDATKMHLLLKGIKFDRIIFNFPLAGFFPSESRQSVIRRHRALVSGFLENAKKMISENGEIHITHKSNGFFREWNLEAIASAHGLRLVQELCFNLTDYPGYHTKYGFGSDKDFNCNPSKTYKFGLASSISHKIPIWDWE